MNTTNGVVLNWIISADEAVLGFRIYRAKGDLSFVPITSALIAVDQRRFVDQDVDPGEKYRYVLAVVKGDGHEVLSVEATIRTTSHGLVLYQNHPNPFNPTTTISFRLPTAERVRLAVYSPDGKLVRDLVDAFIDQGLKRVVWDGRDNGSSPVSSGVYFYRLAAGHQVEVKKMVLLK